MTHTADEVKKEVKIYLTVFGALLFLTIVTVGVSYIKLSLAASIILALFVATIKASLVACYFMHLISEKKFIYAVLIMTVAFFAGLIFLPLSGHQDKLLGTTMETHAIAHEKKEGHH